MYSYLIDTHTHLFAEEFISDIDRVIERAEAAGVKRFVLPAIDSSSFNGMMSLAKQYPESCFPTIGLHPTSVQGDTFMQELDFVKQKLGSASFVAIGEIGIDCYWSLAFIEQQRHAFREQLKLAIAYDLPVIIHSRNSFEEIFAIAREFNGLLKGVFHSFSGTIDDYHTIKRLGSFKVGIGGVLTFKNAGLAELVKQLPIEDIVLETDSPYLTPVPYRGKRNESAYVALVAQRLAEVKAMSLEDVVSITTKNALAVFSLNSF